MPIDESQFYETGIGLDEYESEGPTLRSWLKPLVESVYTTVMELGPATGSLEARIIPKVRITLLNYIIVLRHEQKS